MKRITGLTEDQAPQVAALVVTNRAVRAANVVRDDKAKFPFIFVVEVETYAGEEGGVGLVLATDFLRRIAVALEQLNQYGITAETRPAGR